MDFATVNCCKYCTFFVTSKQDERKGTCQQAEQPRTVSQNDWCHEYKHKQKRTRRK